MKFTRNYDTKVFKPVEFTVTLDSVQEVHAAVKVSMFAVNLLRATNKENSGCTQEEFELFEKFLANLHHWSK